LIDFPDFGGAIGRIAGSVEKMAGIEPGEGAAQVPEDMFEARKGHAHAAEPPHEPIPEVKRGDAAASTPKRPELVPASTRS